MIHADCLIRLFAEVFSAVGSGVVSISHLIARYRILPAPIPPYRR